MTALVLRAQQISLFLLAFAPLMAPVRTSRALIWRAALVFALGFVTFAARARGPYHFDDWITPVSDPASQSLSAFAEHAAGTLRPLSKLTFAFEASIGWSDSPELRRGVSALFHGAAGALLFLLAARLGAGLAAAAIAAAVFCVHPIHAEMVWALAGRGAVMALALILAALLAQLHSRRWLAAGLLFAACLCRETSVLGALPLSALELGRRRGDARELFRRLEPCLTAVLLALSFVVQNARYRELIDYSARGRPFAWSVAGQIEAIGHGVSLYARPSALSLDHGVPLAHSFSSPGFWLGLGLLSLTGMVLVLAIRRRRNLAAVGAALVLALVLPTQSLVPKLDPLTERPFAAALAGVVLLGLAMARFGLRRASVRRVAFGASVALTLVLVQATLARGALYASDVRLWTDAAAKSRTNPRPHHNLALALLEVGDIAGAARAVSAARRIDPFDSELRALAAQIDLGLASATRP